MKFRILSIMCLSWMIGMTSCISDDSTLETIDINQLNIAGSEDDTMPVYNFNLGEDCVIEPSISYDGKETDLTYEWSIGTYKGNTKGSLSTVSNKRVLNYKFLEGGIYYAHLNVTDGKVGKSIDYQININRTFEHGYFLVSNDENGKANLAFVKVMTPEEIAAGAEQVYMENTIELMNEGVSVSKLIDCSLQSQSYEDWRLGTYTRLMAITETQCIFLDPNTLTILAELNYADETTGFKAARFVKDGYSPYFYDDNIKKYLHLNAEYMYLYENAVYTGNTFDDYYAYPYINWGSTYYSTSFADYANDEVYEYQAYYSYFGLPSPFVSSGGLLKGQELKANFMGAMEGYNYPTYVLACSSDGETGYLYKFPAGISYSAAYPDSYPATNVTFALTPETALPKEGTRIFLSSTYNRHYYTLDNKIYVALVGNVSPFPNKSEYALSFPAGEAISYMDYNIDTEEIFVATYNESTKRGNFYIYDPKDVRTDNQDKAEPKAVYKDCADKIVSILYKKSV